MPNPPTTKKSTNSATNTHGGNKATSKSLKKATGKRKPVTDENIINSPAKRQNTATDRHNRHNTAALAASSNRAEERQPVGQPDDNDMLQKYNDLMG